MSPVCESSLYSNWEATITCTGSLVYYHPREVCCHINVANVSAAKYKECENLLMKELNAENDTVFYSILNRMTCLFFTQKSRTAYDRIQTIFTINFA